MRVKELIRKPKDANTFKLKIEIFPPLNVFKISSQSEMNTLFNLTIINFTVTGFMYNSQDGTL